MLGGSINSSIRCRISSANCSGSFVSIIKLSSGFLLIENEIIQYTGITSNTFTGITRGIGTSTAASHDVGSPVGYAQWSPANTASTLYINVEDSTATNGVNLVTPIDGSVKISHAGLYTIIFSAQIVNCGNDFDDAQIWVRVNGNNVPFSMSRSTVTGTHAGEPGAYIMTVNFFYRFNANDVFDIRWQNQRGFTSIVTYGVLSGVPASPAVILTFQQIA